MEYEIHQNSILTKKEIKYGNTFRLKYFIDNIAISKRKRVTFTCIKCNKKTDRLAAYYFEDQLCICSNCIRKENYIKNYGVEHISQLESIKKQKIEKYGYNNPDKIKQTNLEKYGKEVAIPFQSEKYKNSMLKKYGVEHPMKNEDIKNKNTCLHKYVKTNVLSKGAVSYEKRNKTVQDKYGADNVFQLEKCHYASSKSLTKELKKIVINGNIVNYQSNLELDFLNVCNELQIQDKNGPKIPYILDGRKHYYFVDFETDDYIVEIKASHHWYKKHLLSGKIDAKNNAAKKYSESIRKKFLFLLDENTETFYNILEKNKCIQ